MTALLIFIIIIGIIVINQISKSDGDNKVRLGNYKFKEEISNLGDLIEHLEKKKEKCIADGEFEKVERIEKRIKSYYEEKLKLREIIYNNEKYLKNK